MKGRFSILALLLALVAFFTVSAVNSKVSAQDTQFFARHDPGSVDHAVIIDEAPAAAFATLQTFDQAVTYLKGHYKDKTTSLATGTVRTKLSSNTFYQIDPDRRQLLFTYSNTVADHTKSQLHAIGHPYIERTGKDGAHYIYYAGNKLYIPVIPLSI